MIPTSIQAGITAEWSQPLPSEYISFAFEYILQGASKIVIPATAVGNDIAVQVSSKTTSAYKAGDYQYQLIASNGDDKRVVNKGVITIKPDFASLPSGHDFRSHAQRMLDNINQVLEGRITKDVENYQIDGRSITRIPILELQKLKRTYALKVNKEKRKQAGKSSFQPRIVRTRFKS